MYVMKISFFSFFGLGCVCFGWKLLPEMLFRKWGCLVGPENSIFRKLKSVDWKKKPLTTEIVLHFYFPFKVFPENERERESARARDRDLQSAILPSLITISSPRPRSPVHDPAPSLIAISSPRSRDAVDRDLAKDWDRDRRRDLAKIAISPSRDRDQRRELAKITIAISPLIGRRTVFSVVVEDFFLGCGLCFLDLCFSSSFPNTRKYFSENFLKCNQTPWKHFPFPEISISRKYVFSRKRFMPTKHSLNVTSFTILCMSHFSTLL